MSIDYYPHAVLTCKYYILGPRFDDVSTVKVNFSLELNIQSPPSDSGYLILIFSGLVPNRKGKSILMASLS